MNRTFRNAFLVSVLAAVLTVLAVRVWPSIQTVRVPLETTTDLPAVPITDRGWIPVRKDPERGAEPLATLRGWRILDRESRIEESRSLWSDRGWLRVQGTRLDEETLLFQFWSEGGAPDFAFEFRGDAQSSRRTEVKPDEENFPHPRREPDAPWVKSGQTSEQWWDRVKESD